MSCLQLKQRHSFPLEKEQMFWKILQPILPILSSMDVDFWKLQAQLYVRHQPPKVTLTHKQTATTEKKKNY